MIRFRADKMLTRARQMPNEELLDRVTAWRESMEPQAVDIMEAELASRGVGPDDIARHERNLKYRVVRTPEGLVAQCSLCRRPASGHRKDWHRLWGLLPLFKRTFYYCDEHGK